MGLGGTLKVLDPTSQLLTEIEVGGRTRLFHGGRSPLNDAVASRVAEDKYYTHLVLSRAGFRTPETVRCLKPDHFKVHTYGLDDGLQPALDFAGSRQKPIVVKPNRLSHGRYITVIHEDAQIRPALEAVWEYDYLALVQEFAPGQDLRLDYVDGEFLAGYARHPVHLRGDGRSTIRQLVVTLDRRFDSDAFWGHARLFADWKREAGDLGWTENTILPDDASLTLGEEVLNLNRFALAEAIFEVPRKWLEFGRRISKLMGLRHLGIDVRGGHLESDPEDVTIIEVNASPVLVQLYRMGYEDEVIKCYMKILRAAFES